MKTHCTIKENMRQGDYPILYSLILLFSTNNNGKNLIFPSNTKINTSLGTGFLIYCYFFEIKMKN